MTSVGSKAPCVMLTHIPEAKNENTPNPSCSLARFAILPVCSFHRLTASATGGVSAVQPRSRRGTNAPHILKAGG